MSIIDNLARDEAIRALAIQAAADAASDGTGIVGVLRNAKMIETFIRTGSTNGR